MQPTSLLRASGITKSFAGVHALKGVSFELRAGEVHALVGENGAGKSTLIRIITGALSADSGTLEVAGRAVHHNTPSLARSLGIAAIYQQPALFPELTVAENIALGLEGGGLWRRIDWKARRKMAAELLQRAGSDLDPDRLAATLSMPEQQIVEIAKAIGARARILIMDEPTASLSEREVESLFRVISQLRSEGVGLIYISHRLEEISAIADRVTVLRDGNTIDTCSVRGLERAD
ncbi:MAG: sugar ABC transporter ATP-binding protein, partial [Bryobacteraceae bacterium]|nr:sugar ABC transporter ATP-binding protein [Bryobacteraceae bacterium]